MALGGGPVKGSEIELCSAWELTKCQSLQKIFQWILDMCNQGIYDHMRLLKFCPWPGLVRDTQLLTTSPVAARNCKIGRIKASQQGTPNVWKPLHFLRPATSSDGEQKVAGGTCLRLYLKGGVPASLPSKPPHLELGPT